jgi:hypothetical protein
MLHKLFGLSRLHWPARLIVMKRSWAGEIRNVSLLVASAVNSSIRRAFARSWASVRGPRKTSPDGRPFYAISSIGVPIRADHARDPTAHTGCWRIPGRSVLPQPCGCATALHCRFGMVRQTIHEHAAPLSDAAQPNRSHRLIKCAKGSRRYRPRPVPAG